MAIVAIKCRLCGETWSAERYEDVCKKFYETHPKPVCLVCASRRNPASGSWEGGWTPPLGSRGKP